MREEKKTVLYLLSTGRSTCSWLLGKVILSRLSIVRVPCPLMPELPRSYRKLLADYFIILHEDLADCYRMRKALVVPV